MIAKQPFITRTVTAAWAPTIVRKILLLFMQSKTPSQIQGSPRGVHAFMERIDSLKIPMTGRAQLIAL
ncbi:hypothetical protein GCM10011402_37620 [Paracoccus acridae]|uniref:Uncharacterized protein n=1 Tax=Paracoccus acridae TaxID=1795310 RepID=A0ABQ1VMT8_9RHOB|nr:hypothetical protein GCM10011402_37620 [Paracoccus acridae]